MKQLEILANINNLLIATHPTGEDILRVADALRLVRAAISDISQETQGVNNHDE